MIEHILQERVRVRIHDDGVADVRLDRADKLNALDRPMFEAILEAGQLLAADERLRAVVLSGEGKAFCAGLDTSRFSAMTQGDAGGHAAEGYDRIGKLGQDAAFIWREIGAPVVAAVHGVALGGGLQLALAADIRIVAPDARLALREVIWGLIPDMGATALLPGLLSLDMAKDIVLTGRMVSGVEAVSIGLATRVSESPLDDALTMAHELATRNPHAVRAVKRLLDQAPQRSLVDQLADEQETIGTIIGSSEQREAVQAAMAATRRP